MKIKKLLLSSVLSVPFLPVSCVNSPINTLNKQEAYEHFSVMDNSYEDFVQNNLIQEVLSQLFPNEEEKNTYIQEQNKLNNETYTNKIQAALKYANHLTYSLNLNRVAWTSGKASILNVANEIIDNLREKNWLFFLYNLHRFTFVQDQLEGGSDYQSVEKRSEAEENMLLYQNFYQPKSNKIIDFVIQEYSNDEYENIKQVYFLNEEGFIFKIVLSFAKENEKIIERKAEVFGYVYTYPKLLKSNNKLKDFDLKKYVLATQSFENYNLYSSNTEAVLFTDKYGGKELVYTIVDFK
ncbi:aromatic motif membrane protein [Mycoplasmopsis iners]|uniref:aromatic motif membrane protein n=1 Tax=Mycoplasmopsis iners TaxID=76630 RepID=UPI0004975645|nr:aromatic motif membrane protein [Mycoplasmopsis iners]